MTDRAKRILKVLENSDVAKKSAITLSEIAATSEKVETAEENESKQRERSEVENIIADTDVNSLSPMQALLLLSDLKEKLQKDE